MFLVTGYSFTSQVLLEYIIGNSTPFPFPEFISNTQEIWAKGCGGRQEGKEKQQMVAGGEEEEGR